MRPSALFIVNPVAGPRAFRYRRLPERMGPWAEVIETRGQGDATRIAREAAERNVPTVVAVGGDGTVNEVAAGLVGSESALGIVPRGSGNGLARALGLPMDPAAAVEIIRDGPKHRIDVGRAGGRLFCNASGIGFDARVSARFANSRSRGLATYAAITAHELIRYRPPEVELVFDGTVRPCRPFLVVAANSTQYGNGAIIAPRARLDDGLLDLCVVTKLAVLQMLTAGVSLFSGTLDRHPAFEFHRVTHVTIRSDSPREFHIDGEPAISADALEIEVLPAALDVRVPAHIREAHLATP